MAALAVIGGLAQSTATRPRLPLPGRPFSPAAESELRKPSHGMLELLEMTTGDTNLGDPSESRGDPGESRGDPGENRGDAGSSRGEAGE